MTEGVQRERRERKREEVATESGGRRTVRLESNDPVAVRLAGTESVGRSGADDGTTTKTDGTERTDTTNTGRTSSTRHGESGTTNTDGTASTDTGTRTARAGGRRRQKPVGQRRRDEASVRRTEGRRRATDRAGTRPVGAASHSSRDTAGASVDASPAAGRNPSFAGGAARTSRSR